MVFIVLVIALTSLTLAICNQWDQMVWQKYNVTVHNSTLLMVSDYYEQYAELSKTDRIVVNVIDFIQTWSVFFYSIGGILGASYFFYRNKLKVPLKILEEAMEKIGQNDLDILIDYSSKDEMGNLCKSFDMMRQQLITNHKNMWFMMEEQKRLNAAFAHDLRTPLTVLKGYTDLLCKYVPQGKIDEGKLVSTLSLMANHIERLDHYSNTMKEINSLDDITIQQRPIKLDMLSEKINEMISVLDGKNGITIRQMEQASQDRMMYLDETLMMEVFDNVISNALRYAKSLIDVTLTIDGKNMYFTIYVQDDGKGFSSQDLAMATKPYYTDAGEDKTNHFGIGLYICKLLCEKHRGCITLSNSIKQGAIVAASFYIGAKLENS
ncbi:MAG: putative two-component sensor histidine kinase [Herbinix sp.]|nr:putative two-component sensor histidine kinase [Herbinix sp.]